MKKPLLIFLLTFLTMQVHSQEQKPRLLPSEAIALIYYRTDLNPNASREVNSKPVQALVMTENLEGDELFFLGETYFWNLLPNESYAAFEKLKDQNTLAARASWQRMFVININGFQQYKETENMLGQYRNKFKPIPKDRAGASFAVASVAYFHAKQGQPEKAVAVIEDEIDYLDFEGPYKSYGLLEQFKKVFTDTGKEEAWRKMTLKVQNGLKGKLKERKQNMPEKDTRYAVHSPPVDRMLTVMTEKLGYAQTNEKYQELIDLLEKALND